MKQILVVNVIFYIFLIQVFYPVYAYIDPGTGSMLLSLVLSIVGTLFFIFNLLIIKLKRLFFIKNKIENKFPIVIFSEGKMYWKIFKPILDEFEKREKTVTFLTCNEDDYVFDENYKYINAKYIGTGYSAMSKMAFLKADICLMTTPQLDVLQLKRSKFCKNYVHIFHSISSSNDYRLFALDFYDTVLCDAEFQINDIRAIEKKRQLPAKDLKIVGSPYMDYLEECLNKSDIQKNNNFTILIAPTWGQDGLLYKYGSKLIDKLVKDNYNIIIRPHPQSLIVEKNIIKKLENQYSSNKNITFDYDNNNLISMAKADIMISDFSGIMFEYAFLFNKPILYQNSKMNDEIYDYSELGIKPLRYSVLNDIGVELTENNIDSIDKIVEELRNNEKIFQQINNAKNLFWAEQGIGAKNVVNYLIQKQKDISQC